MCNTAAHLVDHVFPAVPVRQWVLSVPFELRLLLARKGAAFGALVRIFAREVARLQLSRARATGIDRPFHGGVSFPQRFGGSLNLNTHVHSVLVDGVFSFAEGRTLFQQLPPPDSEALAALCERVALKMYRWLDRRGLVRDVDDEPFPDSDETSALNTCTRGALGVGDLGTVDDDPVEDGEQSLTPLPKRGRRRQG